MSGALLDDVDARAGFVTLLPAFVALVAVFSVFDRWWDHTDASVVVPVLYVVTIAGAALTVFLLRIRGRVLDDPALEWVATGLLSAGIACLLQGLLIAEAFPLVATPSQTWRVEALAHLALIVFTLGGIALPGRVGARRVLFTAFVALVALNLWAPVSARMPIVVDEVGGFTPVRDVVLAMLVLCTTGTVVAWVRTCGRRATAPQVSLGIMLVIAVVDLVLSMGSRRWLESVWLGTAPLQAAQFLVPAAGLLCDNARLLRVLHEQRLDARLRPEAESATRIGIRSIDLDSETRIRRLLTEQAYRPVFQPIRAVDTGEIMAVEALTRFTARPQRRPELWFEEANAVGLGNELELATFVTAVEATRPLPPTVALSLNLSPVTLLDRRLLDYLDTVDHPRPLILELTEHVEVDDYAALQRVTAQLRSRGIRIAVDDAGAGFASLRHVIRLGPDVIKLDLTLTRDIHRDPVRRALAASLADFARRTGTTLVAEGVEQQAELDALRELGVDAAQGYLLGRPVGIDQLSSLRPVRTSTPG